MSKKRARLIVLKPDETDETGFHIESSKKPKEMGDQQSTPPWVCCERNNRRKSGFGLRC